MKFTIEQVRTAVEQVFWAMSDREVANLTSSELAQKVVNRLMAKWAEESMVKHEPE